MVLEKLGNSLKGALDKIGKALFVDKKLVNELVKDIQRALIEADVNVRLVLTLSDNIKKRMFDEEIPSSIPKRDYLLKVVYEELIALMGGEQKEITIKKKPTIIMLVGLFGSGKTTVSGKLAKWFKKRGNKVAVIQTDTWRPAAFEQLKTNAKQAQVDFFGEEKEKNPVKIYNKYKDELSKYDLVIVDTAGRDALSEELIQEIEELAKIVNPDERILVISADIGQTAQKQAEQFHTSVNVTGVIATKMDGTARAGGALTACGATSAPIIFIGTGEKIDDLEPFRPKNFVGRLLGMGDIEALLEKTENAISQDEAEDITKRMLKGEFNLLDMYEQTQALKKMGPLNKVMEMIPGMSKLKMPKEALEASEVQVETWKYLMDSMTKAELEDPEIINAHRLERIANGSGRSVLEVRQLLKHYKKSKKIMKMFKGGDKNMQKMMQKMGLK